MHFLDIKLFSIWSQRILRIAALSGNLYFHATLLMFYATETFTKLALISECLFADPGRENAVKMRN